MKRRILIALALALVASPSWGSGRCLKYLGDPLILQGKVTLRTFLGPSNYGESPATDKRETKALLTLLKPICVDANAGDSDEAERDQTEVTLVPLHGEDLTTFEGKNVAVLGQLFHANTGHHHTPVLMQIQRIQEPLDLRLLDGGFYQAGGRTFSDVTELESFLRDYKAVSIHLLPSKAATYKQVEAALKAIQAAGGADIGLVGNVASECEPLPGNTKPEVADESAAIARAKQAWAADMRSAFGAQEIRRYEPYHAKLEGSAWHVFGTLEGPAGQPILGGTLEASVCQKNGAIQIWHGQ